MIREDLSVGTDILECNFGATLFILNLITYIPPIKVNMKHGRPKTIIIIIVLDFFENMRERREGGERERENVIIWEKG